MTLEQTIILVLSIIILLLVISLILILFKQKKQAKSIKGENVKIIDGVRYTTSKSELDHQDVKISFNKEDVFLKRDVDYLVEKNGLIIPGKYTILSEFEGTKSFNVRIDGIVRSFNHATDIILQEGQVITPVSHSIILR